MIRIVNGVVIFGPSGIGKATICEELIKLEPDLFVPVSSATSRAPKEEKHGKKYICMTHEEFEVMITKGELLEWNKYPSKHPLGYHYYGTLRKDYEELVIAGKVPLLDIDINGMVQSKSILKDKIYSIGLSGEIEEIESRLRNRGSESEEAIRIRLETGKIELAKYKDFKRVDIIDKIVWYGLGEKPEPTARKIYEDIKPMLQKRA